MEQSSPLSNTESPKLIPLMYLSIFFIAAIIGADLLTYKLIYFFGFTASASIIFFPLTYTISDITVEAYGKKTALHMLGIAVLAEFYVDTLLSKLSLLNTNNLDQLNSAYQLILKPLQEIFWGNLIALALSALMNVLVMNKLKKMYKGHYFIIRTFIATFSSELIYIVIAYAIWFWGVVSVPTLITMMLVSMSFKIVFALVLAYPAKLFTQKILGINFAGR